MQNCELATLPDLAAEDRGVVYSEVLGVDGFRFDLASVLGNTCAAGRQRQAARTGMAIVMLSAGVPMINGGDELYRTQYCNNNPFNIDSDKNWLDWANGDPGFAVFTSRLLELRQSYPELRPADYGQLTFHTDSSATASDAYLADPAHHFLAWSAGDVYVAYNGWSNAVVATLPPGAWKLAGDTSHEEGIVAPGDRADVTSPYVVAPKSLAVFLR